MTKPEKTPEEKAAFKAKMAAAKAAKKAAAASGAPVVVGKPPKKKPKPSAPATPADGTGTAPKKKPWHEDHLL